MQIFSEYFLVSIRVETISAKLPISYEFGAWKIQIRCGTCVAPKYDKPAEAKPDKLVVPEVRQNEMFTVLNETEFLLN